MGLIEKGEMMGELIKVWWTIFLVFGAIALFLMISPVILALILGFCTFILGPFLVWLAVFGNIWNNKNDDGS